MNSSQLATAIAIRDLKCDSLKSMSDRILLQKKIYLAQDIGLPLGYGYSWYIHGPYSTDLTAVAYQVIPEGFDSIRDKTFKAHYAKMILKVNSLETVIAAQDLKIGAVQWYELIASIAYWCKAGYKTKDEIVAKIGEVKPQFPEELIIIAYNSYTSFKHSS